MSHIDNIREFENKSGLSRQVKHLWKLGYLKALKETQKDMYNDGLQTEDELCRECGFDFKDHKEAIKEAEK